MLASLGGVDDWRVLDLYAGSGSFGLECLSRGAAHVTFVERGRPALVALRANIDHLGFGDRTSVIAAPVLSTLGRWAPPPAAGAVFDVAFCDPPYADDPWSELLAAVPADLVVGHADREIVLPPGWNEVRARRYGRARVVIAERESEPMRSPNATVPPLTASDVYDPGVGGAPLGEEIDE